MKLIVGLGNIGSKYDNTRHNIGFDFLDYLAKKENLNFREEKKFKAFIAKKDDIIYIKPTTYMNLSGDSVLKLMSFLQEKNLRQNLLPFLMDLKLKRYLKLD